MKILEIDYDYYYYPENISSMDVFIEYVNKNYNSFLRLIRFETGNCVFPYFVKEEMKEVCVNVAAIKNFSEEEVTVLSRQDYDIRLEQTVRKKCVNCIHYEENSDGDNLKGHREKISLDGECYGYQKKE